MICVNPGKSFLYDNPLELWVARRYVPRSNRCAATFRFVVLVHATSTTVAICARAPPMDNNLCSSSRIKA